MTTAPDVGHLGPSDQRSILDHCIEFDTDEMGFDIAICDCGYESPPCPDREIAAEFYFDAHRGMT